jgi:ectoine hydroxylase-related dioxygenase (phytanoyl-CoA dioxygenase family)
MMTAEQIHSWEKSGYVLLPGFLGPESAERARAFTSELAGWPEAPGKWMKYFEAGPAGERQLCRVENFIDYHAGIADIIRAEALFSLLAGLMREEALLFKEKINYKLPGGSGFAPHQDAPAFTAFGQRYHITMMLAIDPATPENGCLEVVDELHKSGLLPEEPDGTLDRAFCDALTWKPIPMSPGDALLFDSYVPHRSGPNRTAAPRRAFYVTYNRASEGDRRADYYAHKRRHFPPECEREGWTPDPAEMRRYNLANPIR